MLKTIFLSLFLLCFAQLTFSEEIFSLKKSYEIAVIIEGTDQTSIQKGMQNGLSSLLINLSGNSKILTNNKFKKRYLVRDYRQNIRCIISTFES